MPHFSDIQAQLHLHLLDSVAALRQYPEPERPNKAVFVGEKLLALAIQGLPEHITALYFGEEVKDLQYLNVSENKHLTALHFAVPMPHLQVMYAENCGLKAFLLPKDCRSLGQLYLGKNALHTFEIGGTISNLHYLDLSNNPFTTLSFAVNFPQLKHLYADENKELRQIHFAEIPLQLQTLALRNCALNTLPKELGRATQLTQLYLHGNPLADLGATLIVEGERQSSAKAVLAHLRGLVKTIINDRLKMVIVGNGRVGKTTMFKRLAGIPIKKEEGYTHGIKVRELSKVHFPNVKTERLRLKVFDFGGQHIYYAAHQFFLSEKALYVVAHTDEKVAKSHKCEGQPEDEKWRPLKYWLENIASHTANADMLLVKTQRDACGKKSIYQAEFEEKYQVSEEDYFDFDRENEQYLNDIRTAITAKLNADSTLLGKAFPASRAALMDRIALAKTQKQHFVSLTTFKEEWCKAAEIPQGDEEEALKYLAYIGELVYIEKEGLKEKIYLDVDWLTQQIYLLIDNALIAKNGEITDAEFAVFLTKKKKEEKEEEKKVIYEKTEAERKEIFTLLENFKLIFKDSDKNCYIVPQYLPEKLEKSTQVLYEIIKRSLPLAFVFRYTDFMPDNVMIHFLAEYGPYAKQFYWRKGLCFVKEHSEVPCIVEADEEKREISVYLPKDNETKPLQREIFKAFQELGKNTKMEISLKVENFFVPISELKKYENAKIEDFLHKNKVVHLENYAFLFSENRYLEHNKFNPIPLMKEVKKLLAQQKFKEVFEVLY